MANANFVVESLPAYVATNKDLLLKNFALPNKGTRARCSIQTGVKKNAYINFLDMAPALADGTDCTFNADGSATLTQREINTAVLKTDMEICPRNLIGKYAEYLVRVNATEESLPFEQYIMDGVTAELNKKIEKLIWQGDTYSEDADLKWTDGLLKILADDQDAIEATYSASATAFERIKAVYLAMPDEAIERGGEIYVSPALYRQFVMELMEKNLYHYAGPQAEYPEEFYFPGTNVKVVNTYGLSGEHTIEIVGTFAKNIFYGCDMEGDSEDIDLWYSRDNRTFRLEALWNSGVQVAFPEYVVKGLVQAG